MFADPPEGLCKDTSPVAPGGALALSPDGRNAYMAGSVGDQSALAVFDRDQSTGKLAQTSCIQEAAAPSGDDNGETAAVQCSEVDNLAPSFSAWYIDTPTRSALSWMGGVDDRRSHRLFFETGHLSGYAVSERAGRGSDDQ